SQYHWKICIMINIDIRNNFFQITVRYLKSLTVSLKILPICRQVYIIFFVSLFSITPQDETISVEPLILIILVFFFLLIIRLHDIIHVSWSDNFNELKTYGSMVPRLVKKANSPVAPRSKRSSLVDDIGQL